ncbi:hypothetical protein [Streptomyces sp. SID8352]|uniref:hypothetical protein n=1 Tax=Streptomyces sp. SID8352 TaxID=2690338 RepID=UPI00136DFC03|nr:hypothetical protein [Streptomyces sp. SID8352]MYU24017.1 hypothetical protein [Streptomyces sp. SID8352]
MSVRMKHKDLEREIEVPAISVRHYERSGWKRAEPEPPAPDGETAAAPAAETPTAPRRRREGGD